MLAERVPTLPADERLGVAQDFLGFMGKLAELLEATQPSPAKLAALSYVSATISRRLETVAPEGIQIAVALLTATDELLKRAQHVLGNQAASEELPS